MPTLSYREQTDAKRIQQIREITKDLPQSCTDFIRTIAVTTSTLSRLAYAIDLRTFFRFLQTEQVQFSDKALYLFQDEDIARISARDLMSYTEYLTFYYKENDDNETAEQKPLVNHELAIKRKLCSLRSFFDYMFKSERIPSNVTELVPLPKVHEKPIIRLSSEEMQKILNEAASGESLTERHRAYQSHTAVRDYALLMLFLGTGIRVSECVGLNISDIDFEQNAFLVTRKGGNQVVLYFPDEVSGALQDYYQERKTIETLPGHEDAFFLSLQKRRITQRAVEILVKKHASIAAPLKTRISPHKLRSTFATNLYHATGDIYLVADVLGHSSVDTTRKHYADMTDERRRKAAGYVNLSTAEQNSETEEKPDTEL